MALPFNSIKHSFTTTVCPHRCFPNFRKQRCKRDSSESQRVRCSRRKWPDSTHSTVSTYGRIYFPAMACFHICVCAYLEVLGGLILYSVLIWYDVMYGDDTVYSDSVCIVTWCRLHQADRSQLHWEGAHTMKCSNWAGVFMAECENVCAASVPTV